MFPLFHCSTVIDCDLFVPLFQIRNGLSIYTRGLSVARNFIDHSHGRVEAWKTMCSRPTEETEKKRSICGSKTVRWLSSVQRLDRWMCSPVLAWEALVPQPSTQSTSVWTEPSGHWTRPKQTAPEGPLSTGPHVAGRGRERQGGRNMSFFLAGSQGETR